MLVIDDTQKNLEIVGQLLTENNYEVTVANSGERGIAIAKKLLPDLVLLDIMMPDISGFDVCRRLKKDIQTMHIPVIFLTAKTERDDLLEGFESGAVDYVTKPFVKEELLARVHAHSELAVKRHQEELLYDTLDKYVLEVIIDIEGTIRFVSNAFLKLTGYELSELEGKSFDAINHPDTFRSVLPDLIDSVRSKYTYYKEISIITKTGALCVLNTFVEPVICVNGEVSGAQCFMQDVTSKKELEKLSITDKLTGLNNRQKLDQTLNYEISQFQRYGSKLSVILIDLDDFKNVNDNYGHIKGDEVLIKTAKLLKINVRDSDTVGRWGGEEFLVILPKSSEEEAVLVADKLRKAIEKKVFCPECNITASLGVAELKPDMTITNLLTLADKSLYKAKKLGKNRVEVVSEL